MPRRAKASPERWLHPTYVNAYCYKRNGVVYTCVDGIRKSTRLRWTPQNKADAMEILAQRVKQRMRANRETISIAQAKEEFIREELVTKNLGRQKIYLTTFRQFLKIDDVSIRDLSTIRSHIVQVRNSLLVSANTLNSRMKALHRFFQYCISRGWIENNPITKELIPKYEEPVPQIFSQEEWEQILLQSQPNPKLHLSLQLAYQTAMRLNELIELQWEDIHQDFFYIRGKGGYVRIFPYKFFPEIQQIFQKAREMGFEKPVPYKYPEALAKEFRKIRNRIGISKSKTFHTIRKTAINRWSQMGMPVDLRTRLAGQSVSVQFREYIRRPDLTYFESHLAPILHKQKNN